MIKTTLAVLATALLVAAAGCSDDDGSAQPTTTAAEGPITSTTPSTTDLRPTTSTDPPETTSTTAATDPPETTVEVPVPDAMEGCEGVPDNSPAEFDSEQGVYAATVHRLEDDGSLFFDVVQWLTGEDAMNRYVADNPGETEGPPNDYYVVNENDLVRSAPLDSGADIWLVDLLVDSDADVDRADRDGLLENISSYGDRVVYWLTFDSGAIIEVCEQYVP